MDSRWTVVLVVAGTGSTTVHEESAQTAASDRAAGTINFNLFISLIRRASCPRLCLTTLFCRARARLSTFPRDNSGHPAHFRDGARHERERPIDFRLRVEPAE